MIRLTNKMGRKILGALMLARNEILRLDGDTDRLVDMFPEDSYKDFIDTATGDLVAPTADLEPIIREQLGSEFHMQEMLDEIERIIANPWAGIHINRTVIDTLRSNFMRPEMLAKFQRDKLLPPTCVNCQKVIQLEMEATVLTRGAAGDIYTWCSRCKPMLFACALKGCNLLVADKQTLCEAHKAEVINPKKKRTLPPNGNWTLNDPISPWQQLVRDEGEF